MTKVQENKEIRYKAYEQNQIVHLPVLLKDLVADNALVQIIDEIVNQIEMKELKAYYTGIGCPAYHPQMMIKVWVYGYSSGVYTSRPLSRKLREDLGFMYLSGTNHPCHKTLSDFRSCRMKGMVDIIFEQVLFYLVEHGYIKLNDLYIDGSRWEANANKHKVIWRKNTDRFKGQVLQRIGQFLEQVKVLQQQEEQQHGSTDLPHVQTPASIMVQLSSTELAEHIKELNQLVEAQADKKRQRKLKSLKGKLDKEAKKLKKYEEQEAILGHRNSYSKTDQDASFMYSKDGRLLPQYNPQITTSNQYIINPTVHQTASDSATLPAHIERLTERVTKFVPPDWSPDVTADAAYGSEENYDLLEKKEMTAFVKYPLWFKEMKGELAKQPFRRENWDYHTEEDYFVCPQGRVLHFVEQTPALTKNGYERQLRKYECESCENCPSFILCRGENANPQTNRTVQISRKLERYKAEAKERLDSAEGQSKRSQRSVDVETPFGDMKYNMHHRRFILRGLLKVEIEFILLCIGHNLRKIECEQTGKWKNYYAQRAAKAAEKRVKRA